MGTKEPAHLLYVHKAQCWKGLSASGMGWERAVFRTTWHLEKGFYAGQHQTSVGKTSELSPCSSISYQRFGWPGNTWKKAGFAYQWILLESLKLKTTSLVPPSFLENCPSQSLRGLVLAKCVEVHGHSSWGPIADLGWFWKSNLVGIWAGDQEEIPGW